MSPTYLAGFLALTTAAPLPPRPIYQWKFETGRTFYLELSTDTKQEMTVMGSKIVQTQSQVFTFSLMPEQQLPDGTWLVRQKIVGVQGDTPLAELMRGIVGAEFVLTLDRAKGVVAISGREEFLRRLGDVRAEMKPLLQTILTDEALKEMNGQTFAALPERNVTRGDSWLRRSRTDLGPIGLYETTHRYTYTGSKGTL